MYGKAISFLANNDIIEELNKDDAADAANNVYKTSNSLLELIGLILLLLIILFAAYYTTKFVGRVKLGRLKNSNFEVVDTYRISQSKVLQIVKIGSKYIVIAIGKESINYITDIEESDINIFEADEHEKQSFTKIFENLKKKNR